MRGHADRVTRQVRTTPSRRQEDDMPRTLLCGTSRRNDGVCEALSDDEAQQQESEESWHPRVDRSIEELEVDEGCDL